LKDYEQLVSEMLGPPRGISFSSDSWAELEGRIGESLPTEYMKFVDRYALSFINEHLYVIWPVAGRWNLGDWMEERSASFQSDLLDVYCPGLNGGVRFGGPGGLIPLLGTDRGEYLFCFRKDKEWIFVSHNRDELELYEEHVSFWEWVYRFLVGHDAFGPDTAVFYPGPVKLESLPLEGEVSVTWYGPERGM
jgi:hypothetical protein